jgi:Asp/Glu/hydantoin racemase
MRIFASTPLYVGAEELARRQQRYDQISPEGVTIELHDLPADAPTQLNNAEDIARSEEFVHAALEAAPDGFDALLADCVLDPAVGRLQQELDRPVIGILRMNLAYCAALGAPMGAVVRNEAIAAEMRRVAESYGWTQWLTDVEVLDLSFDAISQGTAWQEQLDAAAVRVSDKGLRSLFNGCSAVDVDPDHPSAVPVFDPVIRALELVAVAR